MQLESDEIQGDDLDEVVQFMQDLEQRLKDQDEKTSLNERKNHLRMDDRLREFEAIKHDFVKNVANKNLNDGDSEV